MLAQRLAANTAAIEAMQASLYARYPRLIPDEWGQTAPEREEMAADWDAAEGVERRKALAALWLPPEVESVRRDGVVCYRRNRGDDWTVWRALQATIGLAFRRYWSDAAAARWERRLGVRRRRFGIYGHDMAFWDAGPVYGGYTVEVLKLYPGCRIEHFNDGETNL